MDTRWCRWVRRRGRWRRVHQWLPRGPVAVQLIGLDLSVVCVYGPRHGYWCYRTYRGSGCLGSPRAEYPQPEVSVRRRQILAGATAPGPEHIAPIDSTALSAFPNLVKHCCITRYDDHTPRRPGWITVQTQGAAWMVVCKDPDACAQLRVTGPTLDDALALAELLLGAEDAPWEPDRFLSSQGNGKKK